MENENRQFYRHPVRVPIQLTETDQAIASLRSEDISQGGLSFYWPDPLPEGTPIQVSIPVEGQLFRMSAQVRYSRKDADAGLFKTGARFDDSPDSFRVKLVQEFLKIRAYREELALLRGRQISEAEAADLWVARNSEGFSHLPD